MKKFKVGILMNGPGCSAYLYDTIKSLAAEPAIDLVLIQEGAAGETSGLLAKLRRKLRQAGLMRFTSMAVFALYREIEARVFSVLYKGIRDHFARKSVDPDKFASRIDATPEFSRSGLVCRYSPSDLGKIAEAGLDIIVRGNTGAIYRGDVLSVARLGIISFHHGDNRWNRGLPPGFWEVYLRKPVTGFVIQILSEELDGGTVLFRGEVVTKRTHTENVANLYRESNPFLAYVVKLLLTGDPSVRPEEKHSFTGRIYKYPEIWQTANYALRTAALLAKLFIQKRLLYQDTRWSVAYLRKHWSEASLATGKIIANPPKRFLADPFVFEREGRHYIFVEDYDDRRGLGGVSCIVVEPDDSHRIVENVLLEPFHLSFPLVFEEAGEIFMLPETSESGAIRLYRCEEFPHKWTLDMELIKGVSAADTMLIKQQDKWFMLTNINQFGSEDHLSQLHVLWSDQLRSTDWKRISSLPVINSALDGRNAGILKGRDGATYRVRQRQGLTGMAPLFPSPRSPALMPAATRRSQSWK